ncbi:hypothetical protein [Spiroplasma floricola]|uniref:Uncharacterized protein n=1 Tax=Spiroplasma floricola 23-6 TaxID=1336749 RepID=A0A2K8SFB6_9MOLU|nr:hypothetical protein [Spiroplasma floricola]AUB32134.1 hypothetical protein SFLOR_v1c10880 [Spiroplasma floricola 23-6]
MFKNILLTLSLTSFSTTTVSSLVEKNNVSEKEKLINFLRNDIEKKKVFLGNENYIKFDNKVFTNKNLLNEYLLSNSYIKSEFTFSNPNKIIKDYENMILDKNRIYSLDMDKYTKVYRDAFGNIAKTSKNALDTYTNAGLVKQKYSYDEVQWFDTPEEAKINQKDKMEIRSSLYYIHNNKYYNAFNITDINNLLGDFKKGYFVNKEKNIEGNRLLKPIKEYGDKKDIFDKMIRELKSNFLDSYFYKSSKVEYINKLKIKSKDENQFRVLFPGENEDIFMYGNEAELTFANKYSTYQEMLNDFRDRSKWMRHQEWGIVNCIYYLQRWMDLINPKTGKKERARIGLFPKWVRNNEARIDNYVYWDNTKSTLINYYDERKQNSITTINLNAPRYSLKETLVTERESVYNSWFLEYFAKNITNFGVEENTRINYKDILKEKFIKNIDGSVYKDLLYDVNNAKGHPYSLIKSYYDWLPIKQRILQSPKVINGKTMYQLKPDFYVEKKQLDTYLPLQGKFSTVLKFFYGSTSDISSEDGKLLSDTYEEAMERKFINSKLTLKKKYIAFNVFGESVESGESQEEAIRKLQNSILLNSKMVHKDEYNTWNWNLKKSYDSIISDGRYIVYKVFLKNSNDYIYFPSQERALKAVLSNSISNGSLNEFSTKKYMYTYIDSINKFEYSLIFYDNDIQSAINKILDKRNLN